MSTTESLLVNVKEAAALLSISTRKLWGLTASGEIACIRVGRAVRYSHHDLEKFVEANREGGHNAQR